MEGDAYQKLDAPRWKTQGSAESVKNILKVFSGVGLLCAAFALEAAGWQSLNSPPPFLRPSNFDALSSASSLHSTPQPQEDCFPPFHASLLGVQLPNRSHYCHRADGAIVFEPVPGCTLPPPQPYWFMCMLTAVKGIGIYLILKTHIKEKYSAYEKHKAMVMGVTTVMMTLVSCCLLVHKAWTMETPSMWLHFQCMGTMTCMAPWTSNLLLLGVMCMSCFTNESKVPAEALEVLNKKSDAAMFSMLVTLIALVVFVGPFFVTNLAFALVAFGGAVPLLVGITWLMCCMGITTGGQYAIEDRLNFGPLMAIPAAMVVGISMQWMAAASVYFYTEMSWAQAFVVACSERRSDLYLQNIYAEVLMKAPYLAEIINEAWP